MLVKAFRHDGHELTEKALQAALKALHVETLEDLYADIGAGNRTTRDVAVILYPPEKQPAQTPDEAMEAETKVLPFPPKAKLKGKERPLPIRGLIPGLAVHFARCCHPLPGDRIVGIVTTGKGVTIHTIDCATLESFADAPERWIDVGWEAVGEGATAYTGRLKITVANQPGSLSSLSTVIARHEGNISNLRIVNRSMDFFDMVIDVEVSDVKHLADITAALRATPAINAVERARN